MVYFCFYYQFELRAIKFKSNLTKRKRILIYSICSRRSENYSTPSKFLSLIYFRKFTRVRTKIIQYIYHSQLYPRITGYVTKVHVTVELFILPFTKWQRSTTSTANCSAKLSVSVFDNNTAGSTLVLNKTPTFWHLNEQQDKIFGKDSRLYCGSHFEDARLWNVVDWQNISHLCFLFRYYLNMVISLGRKSEFVLVDWFIYGS